MSRPPLIVLLLLLLMAAGSARGAASIVCESRAAAVALVTDACALDAACRFTVDVPPPGGAAGWDALLVDQAFLVAADDAPLPPAAQDPRVLLWPDAPAWRADWPLLAYASAGPANTNCGALGAALASAPLPYALLEALHVLQVQQSMLARERLCRDTDEVPLHDPATGNMTCVCAPDKDCRPPGFDVDAGLLWALGIAGAVLEALAFLYVVVTAALLLRRLHRLLKHDGALTQAL